MEKKKKKHWTERWTSGKVWSSSTSHATKDLDSLHLSSLNYVMLAPTPHDVSYLCTTPLMIIVCYPAPDFKYLHITLPRRLSQKPHQISPHNSLTLSLEVEGRSIPTDEADWKWGKDLQRKNQGPFAVWVEKSMLGRQAELDSPTRILSTRLGYLQNRRIKGDY